jgi:hypothetical protein
MTGAPDIETVDTQIVDTDSAICHSAEATQEVPPRTTSGTSDPAPIARDGRGQASLNE